MKENKISLSYQIKSIKPSELKDGYVEVMLEPVDKIEYNQPEVSNRKYRDKNYHHDKD